MLICPVCQFPIRQGDYVVRVFEFGGDAGGKNKILLTKPTEILVAHHSCPEPKKAEKESLKPCSNSSPIVEPP